jgi:beta-1,4-mannosyltransferase
MRVLAWPAFKRRDIQPYNWLLYSHMSELGVEVDEFSATNLLKARYDIFHLHWPDHQFNETRRLIMMVRVLRLTILLLVAKLKGTKVIWTIHNLGSHEHMYPRLEALYRPIFARLIDGAIALTDSGKRAALEYYHDLKRVPVTTIRHGHYCSEYPNWLAASDARALLGINSTDSVILCFGQLRPYKNVNHLIHVYRKIDQTDMHLIIAGRPYSSESASRIRADALGSDNIQLHLDTIDAERVQIFINAADLMVFPYRDILNSGTAILALSFGCPVLGPNKGAFQDLQATFGESMVMTYDGALTSQVLQDAVTAVRSQPIDREKLVLQVTTELDWTEIARQTVEFYVQITEARQPAGGSQSQ